MSIRIGILGYGNLGRGVECAVKQNPDMELRAVITRRPPESVKVLTEGVKVCHVDEAEKLKDEIDVLILCGGSATDLPVQTPEFARWFNVVDSFDTHANIPQHFDAVDRAASESGHVSGLGSGNVLIKPAVCHSHSSPGKQLYLLGKGSQPGPFRRCQKN